MWGSSFSLLWVNCVGSRNGYTFISVEMFFSSLLKRGLLKRGKFLPFRAVPFSEGHWFIGLQNSKKKLQKIVSLVKKGMYPSYFKKFSGVLSDFLFLQSSVGMYFFYSFIKNIFRFIPHRNGSRKVVQTLWGS